MRNPFGTDSCSKRVSCAIIVLAALTLFSTGCTTSDDESETISEDVQPDIGDAGGDTEPEVIEPDIIEPDIIEPDVIEPDVIEPDIVEPDIIEPDVEPDVPPVTVPVARPAATIVPGGNRATSSRFVMWSTTGGGQPEAASSRFVLQTSTTSITTAAPVVVESDGE